MIGNNLLKSWILSNYVYFVHDVLQFPHLLLHITPSPLPTAHTPSIINVMSRERYIASNHLAWANNTWYIKVLLYIIQGIFQACTDCYFIWFPDEIRLSKSTDWNDRRTSTSHSYAHRVVPTRFEQSFRLLSRQAPYMQIICTWSAIWVLTFPVSLFTISAANNRAHMANMFFDVLL